MMRILIVFISIASINSQEYNVSKEKFSQLMADKVFSGDTTYSPNYDAPAEISDRESYSYLISLMRDLKDGKRGGMSTRVIKSDNESFEVVSFEIIGQKTRRHMVYRYLDNKTLHKIFDGKSDELFIETITMENGKYLMRSKAGNLIRG